MKIRHKTATVILAALSSMVALPASASPAPANQTSDTAPLATISLFGDANDYITQGSSVVTFPAPAIHPEQVTPSHVSVWFGLSFSQQYGNIDLAPLPGQRFAASPNPIPAQRYPFNDATHAGLDVTESGRGCNTVSGSIYIWKVVYNNSNNISRLDASYVGHCESGSSSYYGEVILGPPPRLGPLEISARHLVFPHQHANASISVYNPAASPVKLKASLKSTSGFTMNTSPSSCAKTIPARGWCYYEVKFKSSASGSTPSTISFTSPAAPGATTEVALLGRN